jgi:zinc D-Ala-D-Ala carboxypeptidase
MVFKIDTIKVILVFILILLIGCTTVDADFMGAGSPPNQMPVQSNIIYKVKPRDTLYSISNKHGVSIAKIKEINKLIDDTVYIGQEIYLYQPSQSVFAQAYGNLILVNKRYTLSSGYVPTKLVRPKVPSINRSKIIMTPEAAKALEALFKKARRDKIKLIAISGYRSYWYQSAIFKSSVKKYGSIKKANQFIAKPGQSEHQTGLAIDLSSTSVRNQLIQSYAYTREGWWLKENASEFGFIIRYPKGKEKVTGYKFEPWHLRYVGKSAAKIMTLRNITLEEYLGKT